MKQRLQIILQKLIQLTPHQGYTTIEELSQLTGSGIRTIHRDLEYLSRTLGFRGVRLERRRGFGVRLLDPLPGVLMKELEQFVPDASSDPSQRPIFLLLYLLLSDDWIKLSELSQVFFISDSSVSTDLTSLESHLPPVMGIERQKGVGVRLKVDRFLGRLLFLQAISAVIPPQVLTSATQLEHQAHDWLFDLLEVSHNLPPIRGVITTLQQDLGLDISPKYLSLVYAYCLILQFDQKRNNGLRSLPTFSMSIPPFYLDSAKTVFKQLPLTDGPPEELELFARFFASCEFTLSLPRGIEPLMGELITPVQEIIERTLTKLEEQERVWLHDDQGLLSYLSGIISAAFRRIDMLHIPGMLFHSSLDTHHRSNDPTTSPALILCQEFSLQASKLFNQSLEWLSCTDELQEAILVLDARIEAMRSRRVPEYRVRILCYEGLGMSVYLKTLAQDVMPSNTSFDYQWDPDFSENPDRISQFDFVISTFNLPKIPIPLVVIGEDWTPEAIREAIRTCLHQLGAPSDKSSLSVENLDQSESLSLPTSSKRNLGISLSAIMEVVQYFFVEPRDPLVDLIDQAASLLNAPDMDQRLIIDDLTRREGYGSLVFEEYGVRVLHCRSMGISRPRAGVIQPGAAQSMTSIGEQSDDSSLTILVLAAPPDLDPQESKVLSEIVVALSEDPGFFTVLNQGTKEEIQKRIMDYFSQLIESS